MRGSTGNGAFESESTSATHIGASRVARAMN